VIALSEPIDGEAVKIGQIASRIVDDKLTRLGAGIEERMLAASSRGEAVIASTLEEVLDALRALR
jgi:hypothetical protein